MSHGTALRRLAGALAWAVVASTAPLAGQEEREPTPEELRIRGTADLRWTAHDNYFQAPADRPDSAVQATSVRVRVIADLVRRLGTEVYVEGGFTSYDTFEPTFGFGGGVRGGRRMLRLEMGAGYDRRLPRLDLGDTFARADVVRAHLEARLRLGRALELTGLGRGTWQALVRPDGETPDGAPDPREEWDRFTYAEFEAKARTRLLGRLFSPEIGIGRGRPWRGGGSIFIHDQRQWHVQVRSMPAPPVYLSVRYRVRERDYPHAPEGSSSFGREDRREQIAVGADFRVAERLSWNLYYAEEKARSNLSGRSFRTRALTLGVTLHER